MCRMFFSLYFTDEWQPVPLVPITDDHQNALSNKLFKLMLKRVGMSPPTNKQVNLIQQQSELYMLITTKMFSILAKFSPFQVLCAAS